MDFVSMDFMEWSRVIYYCLVFCLLGTGPIKDSLPIQSIGGWCFWAEALKLFYIVQNLTVTTWLFFPVQGDGTVLKDIPNGKLHSHWLSVWNIAPNISVVLLKGVLFWLLSLPRRLWISGCPETAWNKVGWEVKARVITGVFGPSQDHFCSCSHFSCKCV